MTLRVRIAANAFCVTALSASIVTDLYASAIDWSVAPIASVAAQYSDNPRFVARDAHSDTAQIADVAAEVGVEKENVHVMVKPELRSYRYRQDDLLNRDDQFVSARIGVDAEGETVGVDADYRRESTLTSERDVTGVVRAGHRKYTRRVVPSVTWSGVEGLSPFMQVAMDEVDYSESREGGLVPYMASTWSAGITGEIDDRRVWTLNAYRSAMRASEVGQESVSVGGQLQLTQDLTDNMQTTASVGSRRSNFYYHYPIGDFAFGDNGWLATLSAKRSGEFGYVLGAVSRVSEPANNGTSQERDLATIRLGRDLSEAVDCAIGVDVWRARYLGSDSGTEDARHYGRIDAVVRWRLDPHWEVDANVAYVRLARSSSEWATFERGVGVSLIWRDEGWHH